MIKSGKRIMVRITQNGNLIGLNFGKLMDININ